jgi:hypothetical protein
VYVKIISTSITLTWYYSFDGANWYQYDSFVPPPSYNHNLYLGTINEGWPWCQPYGYVYYYQFGAWAQSAFSGTFNVQFVNPSYYMNGVWTAIPTAESIYGEHSYFDLCSIITTRSSHRAVITTLTLKRATRPVPIFYPDGAFGERLNRPGPRQQGASKV